MARPDAEWPSHQNILIFSFFLFHYFSAPLADTISAQPSPEKSSIAGFVFVQGISILKIYI